VQEPRNIFFDHPALAHVVNKVLGLAVAHDLRLPIIGATESRSRSRGELASHVDNIFLLAGELMFG
jgi:hypothetical protein